MISPPFKRNFPSLTAQAGHQREHQRGYQQGHEHERECCEGHEQLDAGATSATGANARTKLAQLDRHLHCSVIGTCLSTAELRKLMARFISVQGASDLDIHHHAVALAGTGGKDGNDGDAAKTIHKALDHRHASTLKTFAAARDAAALTAAWDEASRQGEIPGAYWAVLTHRQVTPELRQRVFGEVHMLSHLVGAANRADIRRLVALERDNAELQERLERELQRRQELVAERDEFSGRLQQQALAFERQWSSQRMAAQASAVDAPDPTVIAVHTERRERAEHVAAIALEEAARLQRELDHLHQHTHALSQELSAVEGELRQLSAQADQDPHEGVKLLAGLLKQQRILYVGGRPSSMPAIRDLVLRHGGEFLSHDGGLEVRKGLLAAAVPKSDLVVFPVDCIDHDSALNLKRLSERHGIPFVALRNASVASFAAGLMASASAPDADSGSERPGICMRHG